MHTHKGMIAFGTVSIITSYGSSHAIAFRKIMLIFFSWRGMIWTQGYPAQLILKTANEVTLPQSVDLTVLMLTTECSYPKILYCTSRMNI